MMWTPLQRRLDDILSAPPGDPDYVIHPQAIAALRAVLDEHSRTAEGACGWCSILRSQGPPVSWPCTTALRIMNELGLGVLAGEEKLTNGRRS